MKILILIFLLIPSLIIAKERLLVCKNFFGDGGEVIFKHKDSLIKKLILILVCLFVSLEVKSKSDDLSSKKLLCEDDTQSVKVFEGYEFYSNGQVTYYFYSRYLDAPLTKKSDYWLYTTSTDKIFLERNKLPNYVISHTKWIDRLTLKGYEFIDYDLGEGIGDREYNQMCKIFEGDLYNHLNKFKQNFDNKFKSKQKI